MRGARGAGASAWIAALAACTGGPARSEAAPAPIAARVDAGATVADVIGVNEGVSVPSKLLPQLSPDEVAARIQARIDQLKDLGVRHVRVHSNSAPYLSYRDGAFEGYALADTWLIAILEAGLEPVVMIGPWPGNAPARVTDHYVPADPEAYRRWVVATVERYDGDGVEDAPGLPRGVPTWEVDNEPDLHHAVPPKGGGGQAAPEDFQTPEEFVRVALITAAAIREADPTARVLPGGLFGPDQAKFSAYGDALWADPAFRAAFPEANVHGYSGLAGLWRGVDRIGADARPVWITEVSTSSAERGERAQATELARLYLEALRRGVPRVYWHSLQEAPARPAGPRSRGPQEFVGNHLLAAEGEGRARWKLAAWTLHALATRWAGVPRAAVEPLAAEGGHALRIGEDVYVWADGPAAGEVTLPLPDGRVLLTGLVPEDADGAAVRGEPSWPTRAVRVKEGRLSVDVSGGPVRVAPQGD